MEVVGEGFRARKNRTGQELRVRVAPHEANIIPAAIVVGVRLKWAQLPLDRQTGSAHPLLETRECENVAGRAISSSNTDRLTVGEMVIFINRSHREVAVKRIGGIRCNVAAGWNIQGSSDQPSICQLSRDTMLGIRRCFQTSQKSQTWLQACPSSLTIQPRHSLCECRGKLPAWSRGYPTINLAPSQH